MTNALNQFFIDCLNLKYHSNSQDNPFHEQQVEDLLKKHNLKYESQPNGTHQSPDFRVHYNGKTYDIECKSSKEAYPTYNGGLPKEGVIYVFSSKKYNDTTVFFAEDVVSAVKRDLYAEFLERQNQLLQEFRALPEWEDPERGFDFYCRAMYVQKGGKSKTDYFTHSKRGFCEDRVVNYAF
jgi:nitrous oxide reductase